ncbi:hypothetical protein ACF061_24425 [Streptomyces sp. NPDC015220]|uniref:hypothetical protein n=1 Tax=Streptomyces sp. NPDC015220 TaxID=3364947 RepID=UPI0036F649B9
MSKQASHEVTALLGPVAVPTAPEAHEIHAPARRLPQVSVPHLMGLRTSAARPHRRKVPLSRLAPAFG